MPDEAWCWSHHPDYEQQRRRRAASSERRADVGGVRGRLRRLEREAKEGAVLIQGRDGSVRGFDATEVGMEMFMTHYNLLMGDSYQSEVLEAVRAATPESRAAFEEQFEEITMEAISSPPNGRGRHF
jgi:hypothetical protein